MSERARRWAPGLGSRLAVLRSELRGGEDRVEVVVADLPVECHVGVDGNGSTWIRVTCDPSSVSVDDGSAAVRFTVTADGYRLSLAPETPSSVATHFLEEVVELLTDGHTPGDAGHEALKNWRDLLARPAGAPLSESALVGLYGELEVLETIIRLGGALEHWTGWKMDQNDFRLPGLTIEVKSTVSADYRRVRVHGLRQLADPEDGSDLVLVLRRLESSPNGRSLPGLVDDIVRLGVSRSQLLERLSQVRYSEQHRAGYEQIRFVSHELALRQIDETHPRLVPQMLTEVDMTCVDKVDYELNLNGVDTADLARGLDDLVAAALGST